MPKTKKATKKPVKKTVKKPVKRAKTDAAFLAFAKKKKQAKKPTKKTVKKPAKKVAARKPKKLAHILPVPRHDVVVAPVVDASGVVTIAPIHDDVLNR